VGVLAVALGAWAVAALLLLDDSVPAGLAPPQIDVDATFGRKLVDEACRYERFLVVDWLLAQVVLLAVLWVYARRGVGFVQQSAAGRIGTGMLLGMLGLGIVWILHLPFGLAALWWERRHDTTEIGYVEWALGDWLELGANFLAISLALLIVMALAGWLKEWWWIPGAAAFVGIAALLTFVSPYLVTTKPLGDQGLAAAAKRFEREQGVAEIPIRVE
jgi:hypothetical protein